MDPLAGVLTAFGLSASAGLNAYIPLLIVALINRFTSLLSLSEPWDTLSSWPVIIVLVLLGLVELFADKIPAVNHINDIIQTFIRPTAGAIVFAASANVITEINPALTIIAGIFVAGGVHAVKALAVRPAVSATTAGAANIPVSIAEDILAMLLSILAILIPVFVSCVLIALTAWVIWRFWRKANTTNQTS